MRRALVYSWIAAAALGAAPPGKSAPTPSAAAAAGAPAAPSTAGLTPDDSALVLAWAAGDRDRGLRAAQRLGNAALERHLLSEDRRLSRAALWIAGLAEEAWTLLPALATVAEGRDRRASAAACAAARGAGRSAARIPEAARVVVAAAARFAALAEDKGAFVDVRVCAADCALALDGSSPPPSDGARDAWLSRLLEDADPEVRRGVARLAPPGLPALAVLIDDADPSVARTAAATIAAASPLAGAEAPRLGRLLPAASAWVADASLPPDERAAALRVLWAAGGKAERALATALSKDKTAPAALRETAKVLLKNWKVK